MSRRPTMATFRGEALRNPDVRAAYDALSSGFEVKRQMIALRKKAYLLHASGREWVVLPESTAELLMLRPVGGHDEEVTGVLPAIEPVESATFPLPGRENLGDFTSGRLLRDAARLSTRAGAGPFRWSYVTWRLTISFGAHGGPDDDANLQWPCQACN